MKINRTKYELVISDYEKSLVVGREYKKNYRKKYLGWYVLGEFVLWVPVLLLMYHFGSKDEFFHDATILTFYELIFLSVFYSLKENKMILSLRPDISLMKMIAEDNNGSYTNRSIIPLLEKANVFHKQESKILEQINYVEHDGSKARFLRHFFTRGSGKEKRAFYFYILGISTSTSFPHMYLNYRSNKTDFYKGVKLSLPTEFEDKFSIHVPDGYQVEALQIFSPDVLVKILDLPYKCDIEFVENEMLFILEGTKNVFKDFDVLEVEIDGVTSLASILKPKLERLTWAKIVDKSHNL